MSRRARTSTNVHVLRKYPKSRLPGPAVRMFEFELELDAARDNQETMRVSYDGETLSDGGVG